MELLNDLALALLSANALALHQNDTTGEGSGKKLFV
jgi:hypothetical protein